MRDEEVRQAFERFSADYDARFPRIIPRYAEFHAVIVQHVVERLRGGRGLIVDLGCGTGELSRRLLEGLPDARLHAVDLSPAMVERARAKLEPWRGRVSFEVANILEAGLPPDTAAAVSALAVHHLDPAEKRELFRRIARSLAPGGLFVLGDAVEGGSPSWSAAYERRWVEHMTVSEMGGEEVASVLRDHAQNDRFSGLEEQVAWMREAGFREVECLWKHFLLVVVAAETES